MISVSWGFLYPKGASFYFLVPKVHVSMSRAMATAGLHNLCSSIARVQRYRHFLGTEDLTSAGDGRGRLGFNLVGGSLQLNLHN